MSRLKPIQPISFHASRKFPSIRLTIAFNTLINSPHYPLSTFPLHSVFPPPITFHPLHPLDLPISFQLSNHGWCFFQNVEQTLFQKRYVTRSAHYWVTASSMNRFSSVFRLLTSNLMLSPPSMIDAMSFLWKFKSSLWIFTYILSPQNSPLILPSSHPIPFRNAYFNGMFVYHSSTQVSWWISSIRTAFRDFHFSRFFLPPDPALPRPFSSLLSLRLHSSSSLFRNGLISHLPPPLFPLLLPHTAPFFKLDIIHLMYIHLLNILNYLTHPYKNQ